MRGGKRAIAKFGTLRLSSFLLGIIKRAEDEKIIYPCYDDYGIAITGVG